jgi:hypothetical protein
MNENERETPMTSAIIAQYHKRRVEAGKGVLDHDSNMELIGALAFHSEALERMCAELADELNANPSWFDATRAEQLLTKYAAMKEGK